MRREPVHVGNGVERERVAEVQRARMLAAMVGVCAERGAANVAVAHVVERAGVSRRTFYDIFDDCEDCLLAALDSAVVRAGERVLPAYRAGGARWNERVRAGLCELLCFLEEEPSLGRLLIVESLAAGRRALARRSRTLTQIASVLDGGRNEARSRTARSGLAPVPPLAAEGVTGAVFSVLHARMLEERSGSLLELLNPLMSLIVMPYLGPAAARRELERPTPVETVPQPHADAANPLGALGMRLTYRTMRVLNAIAENPGSSNRQIATVSGIGDQGQISKLLARLEKLGLIENPGGGAAIRGGPNAWRLTSTGQDVQDTLTAQL